MIWPLNAPASPRSLVTSMSPTFCTFSCSSRIGRLGRCSAAWAACRVIRRIADAYGRSDSMRCSARRSRAAEIISIARVIFWTFLTDATRPLSSLSAMAYAAAPAGSSCSSLASASPPSSSSDDAFLRSSTSTSSSTGLPSSSRS